MATSPMTVRWADPALEVVDGHLNEDSLTCQHRPSERGVCGAVVADVTKHSQRCAGVGDRVNGVDRILDGEISPVEAAQAGAARRARR